MSAARENWKLGLPELNTDFYGVSSSETLTVNDGTAIHDAHEIAKRYGTPLEIFVPSVLTSRVGTLADAFAREIEAASYRGSFSYHYPMKVNQRKEFVMSAVEAGAQLETSSVNELALLARALDNGEIPAKTRILCNGPKTDAYIDTALSMHREGRNVVPIIESEEEMLALSRYDGVVGVRVDMNLKIESHWDKKFNRFGLPEQRLLELPPIPNLEIVSYHISSQIELLESVLKPIDRIVRLYAELRKKNPGLRTINIGGGAGVPYGGTPLYSAEGLAKGVVGTCVSVAKELGVEHPNIICEWGRYMAAPAQLTIFKVIGGKRILNGPADNWYVIDGSFIANLPDTWSIHQRWHIVPANRMRETDLKRVWFAGSSCDSDDEYVPDDPGSLAMPALREGDPLFIAVLDTGAYQDPLASRHCLLGQPQRLSLAEGSVTQLAAPETPYVIGAEFGW